ncbi:MAG TPA: serine/threonine-protein kinase, partial [Polyangia bacterium]|nr:serine/threonine-protein kinase [Polyangia bacterium]
MVEIVREPGPSALPRGATIGRYTILAPIGVGGVGEVFAAYDPELDRKVALKLLRAHGDANDVRAQARLLREAKAMARLAHPNVVAVHDAGAFGARVFVAMEFVDGLSLKDWLVAGPRTRTEILSVFTAAARGLAAAHAAGLVHRDFKPGNVMIGLDGAVRVMDFGLAREMGDGNAGPTSADDLRRADSSDLNITLTATGELMGTPLYMSPEQFRTAPTDARTDQFSFCVALYQALYGEAPFGDANLTAIMIEVLAGRVRPAPPKTRVPSWLRRVLLRGLSVAPDARWPSMNALVAALARDPARARQRTAVAVGVLAIVALSTLTLVRAARRPALMCQGGPARLAAVWEPTTSPAHPRHDAVRAAFLASGAPGAREVWERVAVLLDRYGARWLASYSDACEATHVRGEQSAATLDLRMACLDERRTAILALTDVLAKADRVVVRSAVDSVNALPALERCADPQQILSPVEPPRDAAIRRRVDELRTGLAQVKALNDTGKRLEARELGRARLAEARATSYRPIVAEALHALESTYAGFNFMPESRAVGEETVDTAIAVSRDDFAAEAAIILAGGFDFRSGSSTEGLYWKHVARALLDRLGGGHELLRAWLLNDEALNELHVHDPKAALASTESALELKEKVLPPEHPDIAISLGTKAEILVALGRGDEALRLNARLDAMFVQAYGTASTEAAASRSNRAEYLVDLDRAAEAITPAREALEGLEAQLGPEHVYLSFPLIVIGRASIALGRPA